MAKYKTGDAVLYKGEAWTVLYVHKDGSLDLRSLRGDARWHPAVLPSEVRTAP